MACTSWLGERQVGSSAEKRENSGGEGLRKGVVVVVEGFGMEGVGGRDRGWRSSETMFGGKRWGGVWGGGGERGGDVV